MKVAIYKGKESTEEFEKISDAIIRDLVNLRGMPTDEGQYMRYSIREIKRNTLYIDIELEVCRVKCSRLDDF